jgi:glycerol uptake facilitator-like aquaporin
MLGGIVAAAILHALTPGALGVQARLSTSTSVARGLFIEMFATAGLTLSVLMLAAGESEREAGPGALQCRLSERGQENG